MIRLIISVFLILSVVQSSPPGHQLHRDAKSKGPLPVRRGGKWGYIDHTGKIVIAPRFETAEVFYEGLAAVRLNGYWGFIDPAGNLVIAPRFTSTSSFSDGVAAIFIDADTPQRRVYGYIDKTGQMVFHCAMACGRPYFEGMMAEAVEIFRCVDELGRPVPKQYPCAPDAASRSHAVMVDRWGFYDKSGKLAIPGDFHSGIGRFSEGLAAVQPYGTKKVGYINKSGEIVISPQFERAQEFSEGLAPVQMAGKWGFIDHRGNLAIGPQFDGEGSFSDGYAMVYLQGKAGYVDRTGRIVISPRFAEAAAFSEGLAAVCCEDGKTGYINKAGVFAISATLPPGAFAAGPFSEGIALTQNENGAVYMDRNGKIFAPVEAP